LVAIGAGSPIGTTHPAAALLLGAVVGADVGVVVAEPPPLLTTGAEGDDASGVGVGVGAAGSSVRLQAQPRARDDAATIQRTLCRMREL
jgi:hypothetical protein